MTPEVSGETVCQHILAHPWFLAARTVMAYSAIAGEIDVTPVLEETLRRGKTLLLPRCQGDTMTARRVTDLETLVPGPFGILEPGPKAEVFPPEEIDLILVPAMAYDKAGNRLGRGKGCYDRFLPRTKGKTIGVSAVLLPSIPAEAHDVAVMALAERQGVSLCGLEETRCHFGKRI